jgi:undecaprenyl-diphosphatase
MSLWIVAIALGVVEGLTEFLPVSSTGHLIVASKLMGFEGRRAETFEIVIQLGAILAVVWEYRAKLRAVANEALHDARARILPWNLALAFLPSALLGVALHHTITTKLFAPLPVGVGLVLGALLIFLVEGRTHTVNAHSLESVSRKQALLVGCAQCLALWPGLSRSAATILGGVAVGIDRRTATEFSFFLAIPTMLAAAAWELRKSDLANGDAAFLLLSFAVSFVTALVAIRWLLRFVATHTFRPFAWYRLFAGAGVIAAALLGWF